VFWVISVYFDIRNILPKSGTFLLGHSVYERLFDNIHPTLEGTPYVETFAPSTNFRFLPRDFFLLQDAHTGSWTTHPYMQLVLGYLFPAVKRLEPEAEHSPLLRLISGAVPLYLRVSLSHACERLLK